MGFGLAHLALCLLVAGRAGAQVVNPGFETAGANSSLAASWTVNNAAGGPVYGVRTNNNPHSGSSNFEVHLASVGAGPLVEFNQSTIPVTGGAVYGFVFYADAQSGSAGYNAQYDIVWNAGTPTSTGYTGFNPGNNAYAYISNSITAPTNATSATIFFHFAGAASLSQTATIDIDDVSLSTTNVVSGGGGGGGNTATNTFKINIVPGTGISWFASNSVAYQVQWASNSISPNWNNLGNQISGNGSTNTVFDATGAPHNFYQVLSIQ